jgi:hypothetical protein
MKSFIFLTLVSFLLAACATNEFLTQPTIITTTTSSPQPLVPLTTPSYTPSPIPLPTNTYTASPEPDIAPNCRIANEGGRLYLLSGKEFSDLGTLEGELDRALVTHYPEWANYRQRVSWSTQPVKLGEIIVSASLDEYSRQINPAVTLVVLGESVDWQLPTNTDLFLRAQEISQELQQQFDDFDSVNPQNESLRSQYPEVANSATYALYAYFNYNLDRLQSWCNTYQQLFGTPQ